jgi:hypothetical protein
LADAGVNTETIMKIVGHSSVEMFIRYRTVKARAVGLCYGKARAAINTPVRPAKWQLANLLTN